MPESYIIYNQTRQISLILLPINWTNSRIVWGYILSVMGWDAADLIVAVGSYGTHLYCGELFKFDPSIRFNMLYLYPKTHMVFNYRLTRAELKELLD